MALLVSSPLIITWTLIVGIIVIGFNYLKWRNFLKQASKLPGPPTNAFIGNLLWFRGTFEHLLVKHHLTFEEYPDIYRLWLGPHLLITINDASLAQLMLLKPTLIERPYIHTIFKGWMGTGLITAPEKIWRIHRKLIGTTFRTSILRSFVPTFAAHAKTLVDNLKAHAGEPEFDLQSYLTFCTLDMICETTMGVKLRSQMNPDSNYVKAMEMSGDVTRNRFIKFWLHSDSLFNMTQLSVIQRKSVNITRSFCDNVIESRRKLIDEDRQRAKELDYEVIGDIIPKRKALLDLLLECTDEEGKLTNEEMIDEANTMLLAGVDSTSTGLCFLLLIFATYPDIQEKVYQELREISGSNGSENYIITYDDLNKMVYFERVIKEMLRLFPLVAFTPRTPTSDLFIGDYPIPKGSTVTVSMYALHRNEKFWPDPLKFDPDRFLPEKVAQRHPFAYLPFGGGPRNCIGSRYAMMVLKITSALILQNYVLKKENVIPVGKLELTPGILLKPVEPVTLRIEKR